MAFSSISVANSFLELASDEGKSLTNMQVQKLVYLAHGYCWALLGKPLFDHHVHAWQWGPVIPKLYKKLQRYGAGTVTEQIEDAEPSIPTGSEEYSVIKAVWKGFGHYTGPTLSRITHQDGSPWINIH